MSTDKSDAILDRLMGLHPKIIDLTLDRMWRLLDALGNPQYALPPVIHIAGTNGKGSTLAMIRAGLEGIGLSAHAYSSPHLVRFHERIRLAGKLIDEDHLNALLNECETSNDGKPITYFEITTCAALLGFARQAADYTLLEVGLGGRLDATNVIEHPAISVITPVALDHQQYLGETITQIATEKAGILKPNSFAIIAPQDPAAMDVFNTTAQEVGTSLKHYGEHWHVWEEHGRLIYQDERGLLDLPRPALIGGHQIINAGTAIATLRYLGVRAQAAEAAMTQVHWPARMQRLRSGPLVQNAPDCELWLDGGHNPQAGAALANVLSDMTQKPLYLVVGMLNTKDVAGYLRPLVAQAQGVWGVSIPNETATLSAEETAQIARDQGAEARAADTIQHAIAQIVKHAPQARILICGSLYLAGQVLRDNQ